MQTTNKDATRYYNTKVDTPWFPYFLASLSISNLEVTLYTTDLCSTDFSELQDWPNLCTHTKTSSETINFLGDTHIVAVIRILQFSDVGQNPLKVDFHLCRISLAMNHRIERVRIQVKGEE